MAEKKKVQPKKKVGAASAKKKTATKSTEAGSHKPSSRDTLGFRGI